MMPLVAHPEGQAVTVRQWFRMNRGPRSGDRAYDPPLDCLLETLQAILDVPDERIRLFRTAFRTFDAAFSESIEHDFDRRVTALRLRLDRLYRDAAGDVLVIAGARVRPQESSRLPINLGGATS